MSKKKRKSTEKPKISAMLLDIAGKYIDMGESSEEKENYLRCATSAWNIACLPLSKREVAIREYLAQYQAFNNADETDCAAVEENIRLLIKQKDEMYPHAKIVIVDSKINRVNGEDQVVVASLRMG
ncbi:MAG: hypothetical protein EHM45_14120 [Desulfobacteraceae bacterium]|nr:MAG: hypothetical protein EHM45_14120 [Desulfobacteraceae bacterium]